MPRKRRRAEEDFSEEIQAHLEIEADRYRAEGLSEQDARSAALRTFGNVTQARERFYESGRLVWLDQFRQDLRYALRMLARTPALTAVMILTLAIGIGANAALFSVVDCLLVRPLPYPDSERLVILWSRPPQGGVSSVSPANFFDFREQSRSFEHMSAVMPAAFNVSVAGVAERLQGFRASAGLFETLGVRPALGRLIGAGDDRPGAPRVAVLSYGAWVRRFGADARILGKSIQVDGESCTVAGVLPGSFRFVFAPEIWLPLTLDRAAAPRDFHVLAVLGKLKRGVRLEQARRELEGIAANLARAYPTELKGWGVDPWAWRDNLVSGDRRGALVLFGAVGFVLLIACVNLANLLLAKAAVRQRELAVRASLGAGRARLMRQMLTESVLLSLAGGAAGILVAGAMVARAATLVSEPILPGIAEVGIDWRILAFTLALSLLTGLLFGVAPAWRASKVNLHNVLKDTNRTLAGGRRFRAVLVAAELALSLVLLVGAGLLARSLAAMRASDPGFEAAGVVTMRLTMPESGYGEPAQVRAFARALLERVRALPGVRSATLASALPLQHWIIPMHFEIAGHPAPPDGNPRVAFQCASDGYFETLGMPLRRGRFFSVRDDETGPRIVVVNEGFVKRYLGGEEPLGARLVLDERWIVSDTKLSTEKAAPARPWEIVGVTASVKIAGMQEEERPQVYAPLAQYPRAGGVLAVRTQADPAAMAKPLRAVVGDLDRNVPVTDIKTLERIADEAVAQPRTQVWISAIFAVVALVLAALGVYGMMSYSVTQSRQEMGVRLALGARPRDLLWMTLLRGMRISAAGLGVGLAASFALARVLRNLLYSVKPNDPATMIAVSLLLLAVALVAVYIPARRAAGVDPAISLRCE